MKQIFQHLESGTTDLADVPCPQVGPGHVLIRTAASLISAGTERMLVDFAKAGLIGKARQQPDKVRVVLDKARADGLLTTIDAVRRKLGEPLPLGYCNAGRVLEVGRDVAGFAPGDRVVSNGRHAEIVCVPANLCARIPEAVGDEDAAFTVLGAVALQGIRLAQPTLGEAVVVTGLGVIGLMAVQLLRAHGCRVMGMDFDPARLALARQFGAEAVDLAAHEDPVRAATMFSRGRGVDAVLITTSTDSNDPVHQAAQACRKRGRIVLVGVAGLELSRADFFEKELTFQVSCSYGPGRYDANYEGKGLDYPIGYVRWTEQRNFEAVLDMMADRCLDVAPLVSHRFGLDEVERAYALVQEGGRSLGILLHYSTAQEKPDAELRRPTIELERQAPPAGKPTLGFVGAGNYAAGTLIPAFRKTGARLKTLASIGGASGLHVGRKFGFEQATTDADVILSDPDTDAVVIATRHDSHARLVIQSLGAGKHVFVEKPLALTREDLDAIERACAPSADGRAGQVLAVGFNRRFAPHIQKMKALLGHVKEPKVFAMTVNAGAIPPEHWTQDPAAGGGRIVGEACHFIDLLRFLAGSPIESFQAVSTDLTPGGAVLPDNVSITLRFADGSLGTILYTSSGHRSFPKERLQVFAGGGVLELDNFRRLAGFGWPRFRRLNLWRQDKGQKACARAFIDAVRSGGPSPIPLNELLEVSRVAIEVSESLR